MKIKLIIAVLALACLTSCEQTAKPITPTVDSTGVSANP